MVRSVIEPTCGVTKNLQITKNRKDFKDLTYDQQKYAITVAELNSKLTLKNDLLRGLGCLNPLKRMMHKLYHPFHLHQSCHRYYTQLSHTGFQTFSFSTLQLLFVQWATVRSRKLTKIILPQGGTPQFILTLLLQTQQPELQKLSGVQSSAQRCETVANVETS